MRSTHRSTHRSTRRKTSRSTVTQTESDVQKLGSQLALASKYLAAGLAIGGLGIVTGKEVVRHYEKKQMAAKATAWQQAQDMKTKTILAAGTTYLHPHISAMAWIYCFISGLFTFGDADIIKCFSNGANGWSSIRLYTVGRNDTRQFKLPKKNDDPDPEREWINGTSFECPMYLVTADGNGVNMYGGTIVPVNLQIVSANGDVSYAESIMRGEATPGRQTERIPLLGVATTQPKFLSSQATIHELLATPRENIKNLIPTAETHLITLATCTVINHVQNWRIDRMARPTRPGWFVFVIETPDTLNPNVYRRLTLQPIYSKYREFKSDITRIHDIAENQFVKGKTTVDILPKRLTYPHTGTRIIVKMQVRDSPQSESDTTDNYITKAIEAASKTQRCDTSTSSPFAKLQSALLQSVDHRWF